MLAEVSPVPLHVHILAFAGMPQIFTQAMQRLQLGISTHPLELELAADVLEDVDDELALDAPPDEPDEAACEELAIDVEEPLDPEPPSSTSSMTQAAAASQPSARNFSIERTGRCQT
jgi:hypothetical protein